jgi:hypothetical protein
MEMLSETIAGVAQLVEQLICNVIPLKQKIISVTAVARKGFSGCLCFSE